MDCVCSYSKISLPQFRQFSSFNLRSSTLFNTSKKKKNSLAWMVSRCNNNNNSNSNSNSNNNNNNNNNNNDENRAFNGLTAPLMPTTEAGRLLCGVLQNDKPLFYEYVESELDKLNYIRKDALRRSVFSVGTDEVILHKRIYEVRKLECQKAIEDIMYMLIVYSFSQIGVHMVPKLSNCMSNGRLEILPPRDWELESIHSVEVLEMVKKIRWEDMKANVKDRWGLTRVKKDYIRGVYRASIFNGYFFKSTSLRYHLEQNFDRTSRNHSLKQKSVDTGLTDVMNKYDNFRYYVMNLDTTIKIMSSRPKFKEVNHVIENHCSALFGNEIHREEVLTSFASLKRLVLEAVAFGSFVWDAEDHIRKFYPLQEYNLSHLH